MSLARASAWRFGRRCSDSWRSLSRCSKIELSTCRARRSLPLEALFEAHAVKNDKELKFGQNFMLRCYPQLSQEQMDELAEWEAMLCEPGEGERLAFRPALQRQLEKFIALLLDRAEYFQSLQKPSRKSLFEAHAVKNEQGLKFGQNFMRRCYPKLSQGQKDELAEWEAMLCEPGESERLALRPALQRQVDRFVALLASRRAEFLQEKESSLGALSRCPSRPRQGLEVRPRVRVLRAAEVVSRDGGAGAARQQLLAYARQRGRRARLRTSPSCMSRSARSATTCLARGCQSACASYTATAWTRRPASEPSSTERTRWTRFCRSKSLRPASTARKGGSGPPGHATPCRARSRPLPSRRATLCRNCLSVGRKGSPKRPSASLRRTLQTRGSLWQRPTRSPSAKKSCCRRYSTSCASSRCTLLGSANCVAMSATCFRMARSTCGRSRPWSET